MITKEQITELFYKLECLKDFFGKKEILENIELPVHIAKILYRCRICKKDCREAIHMTYNYGNEFAHTECLEKPHGQ